MFFMSMFEWFRNSFFLSGDCLVQFGSVVFCQRSCSFLILLMVSWLYIIVFCLLHGEGLFCDMDVVPKKIFSYRLEAWFFKGLPSRFVDWLGIKLLSATLGDFSRIPD